MIWFSLLFQGKSDLCLNFCGEVFYDIRPKYMDKFLLLHSGFSLVSRVSISVYLLFWHSIFRNLLSLDNYIYQTQSKILRNISPAYQNISHNTKQKWQVDILKLNTTVWHYKKKPITSEQGCRNGCLIQGKPRFKISILMSSSTGAHFLRLLVVLSISIAKTGSVKLNLKYNFQGKMMEIFLVWEFYRRCSASYHLFIGYDAIINS